MKCPICFKSFEDVDEEMVYKNGHWTLIENKKNMCEPCFKENAELWVAHRAASFLEKKK